MTELVALLTALAPLVAAVAAVGAVIVGFLNRRAAGEARQKATVAALEAGHAKEAAEASQREIIATKAGVFEVGKQIDGRLSELLEITRTAALAEGRLQGAEEEGKRRTGFASFEPLDHDSREGR